MARTKSRIDARERARLARLRVDAEREQRDRKIEDAAAEYFTALDEHGELAAKLKAIESRMHTAVLDLLDLGESQARVAALLEIEAREVRRIRAEADQLKPESGVASSESSAVSSVDTEQPDPQTHDESAVVHNEPTMAGVGSGV
ncbi:hypothetical protein ATJ97_0105 [Georgenia soli]|uniref:Uncharacterized protein n=1 Tax=Georgenia soli TaxID=638953 RepID=A0A2A9F3B5_9MICO|nr:hypothetical protein [Georgenia soli]PFG45052.1 hypothetical protein ATJ97_0105 [Georgenia soli]